MSRLYMYYVFFIHSSADEHLDCFHVLTKQYCVFVLGLLVMSDSLRPHGL